MSSCNDEQEEEKEVLLSIYDADDCFKHLDDQTYQYRMGEAGHFKSFLLEIKWGDSYPEVLPTVNMETFYNKHVCPAVKGSIKSKILSEADQWIGTAMTYTLFEFAKENADDLMAEQTEDSTPQEIQDDTEETPKISPVAKVKQKKEQLTKAQKRRITERTDFKGERARGWNWVDIIKLSKSGGKPES